MKLISFIFLFTFAIAVIAGTTQDSDGDTPQIISNSATITNLPNDLLHKMIFKMDPGDAGRFTLASKKIYNSIGKPQKTALFWIHKSGRGAFIPYMAHLNKSYSELNSTQKQTADILVKSYPTPEALIFYAFKNDSLAVVKYLEKLLGRHVIEEKLRLIKKQSELYPDKYPGNLTAKFEKLGYGDITIEPMEERFAKLKSFLGDIQFSGEHATIKQDIIKSYEPKVEDITWLVTVSPTLESDKLLASLIEFGADIDSVILPHSVKHPRLMKYLFQNGADIDYRNANGCTTLHVAATNGRKDLVELLLDHGANANAIDTNEKTPLHVAADHGHKDVVKLLLDRGAYVNSASVYGRTPLHCAAHNGKKDVVQMLIDRGANVNVADTYKWTPLHLAVTNEDNEIVEILLKQEGIKTEMKTRNGYTAKKMAALSGYQDIAELIKQHEKEHSTTLLARLIRSVEKKFIR